MKYKILSAIVFNAIFGGVSAQSIIGSKSPPLPEYMQKMVTCQSDPNNEICKNKINDSINNGKISPSNEDLGKLNLKGLNLKMTRQDVLTILPNAKQNKGNVYEGKVIESYICGKHLKNINSLCNFTFGGVEMAAILIQFWGDDVTAISLFFNDYNQSNKDNFSQTRKNIRDGLDIKYKEYASPEPAMGRRDVENSFWRNKSELLSFDLSHINTDKNESLNLVNIALNKEKKAAIRDKKEKDQELKDTQRINKSTSDM